MNFSGKTVLITGAAVGIGRAAAYKFAEHGARLVLTDIALEKLETLKKELSGIAEDVLVRKCDVSDEARVYEVVKEAEAAFGRVDILINNAALWRDKTSFPETSAEDWKRYIDINIMGVVYFTKAVLGKMLENHYGKIINVASVAGVYGNANMAHYSATKGAVISLTKALAKEVAGKGISVNAVSPGTVSPSDNPDMTFHRESELSYMGRTGTDAENAALICFLAGDEADYISGQNIQIDGCRKRI